MTSADEHVLAILAAKQEIAESLYRYCRAMDRIDRRMAREVWHPGGIADYGDIFQGTGAGFAEWVSDVHETLLARSHQVANILIEVDGETARSEAYVTVALQTRAAEGQPPDIIIRGRYLDRWSYRDGRWAIDHRSYVTDLA